MRWMIRVVSCVDGLVQVRSWVQKNQCHSITGRRLTIRRSKRPELERPQLRLQLLLLLTTKSRHNSLSTGFAPHAAAPIWG